MENIQEQFEVIPNINYDIYNALNLACEDLGQQYLNTGFNPFDKGFVLDEEYIADSLLNCKNCPEIKCPEFIEKGEKASNQAFSNSLENCTNLLAELESKANSPELTAEQKAKLQKLIAYLKMRIELLMIFTQKQKKQKNKFNQYKKLLALNYLFADYLEDSFNQNFDSLAIANQLYTLQINQVKETAHQANIIEQAKQIIANNQKAMQSTEQKTVEPANEEINPYQKALEEINAQKQTNQMQKQENHTTKPQTTEEYKKYDDFSR